MNKTLTLYKRSRESIPRNRKTDSIMSSADIWELIDKMKKIDIQKDKFFYFIEKDIDDDIDTYKEGIPDKKIKEKKNGEITEAWIHNMIIGTNYQIFHNIMKKEFKMIKINRDVFIVKKNKHGEEKNKKMKLETLIRDYRLLSIVS